MLWAVLCQLYLSVKSVLLCLILIKLGLPMSAPASAPWESPATPSSSFLGAVCGPMSHLATVEAFSVLHVKRCLVSSLGLLVWPFSLLFPVILQPGQLSLLQTPFHMFVLAISGCFLLLLSFILVIDMFCHQKSRISISKSRVSASLHLMHESLTNCQVDVGDLG